MVQIKGSALRSAALLAIAAVAVGALGWQYRAHAADWASGSAAEKDAKAYSAQIHRDHYGVPHVYGATDADTAFGLAYAHAEDDFDNIENAILWGRAALASKLGEAALPQDRYSALLQASRIARENYARDVPPKVQRIIEGYVAGLNSYLKDHPHTKVALAHPIVPEDIAAYWYAIMPLFFGLQDELASIANGRIHGGVDNQGKALRTGSNGFAVAAGRSTDGVTRIVHNSHQPWEGTLTWYEAGFHSREGLEFYGGLFPGTPFPTYGHNGALAWTYTVNRPDLTDTFELDLHPHDPKRYRFGSGWRSLSQHPVSFVVSDGGKKRSVSDTVEWSVHGPVVRQSGKAYAVRYSSIGEANQLAAFYDLVKAKDFATWRKAMARQRIPAVNFVYADRDGNIGYFHNARVPRREARFAGKRVLPGADPAALWTSYHPFDATPQVVNPKSGFVVSANNSPYLVTSDPENPKRENFPANLGLENTETNRAQRLVDLLAAKAKHSRDDVLDIKFDCRISPNTAYLARYFATLKTVSLPASKNAAEAKRLVEGWSRSFDSSSSGASLAVFVVEEAEAAMREERAPKPIGDLLAEKAAYLERHFGTIDPKLGDLQRLRRGTVDQPLNCGGPDVIRAINAEAVADGRLQGRVGDSLVMLVEWGADKRVRASSIHQYGAATTRPTSPHYADQVPLFAEGKLKPAWFYEQDVRAHSLRSYSVSNKN